MISCWKRVRDNGNVKTFYVDVKHVIFLYDRDRPGLIQLTGSDSIVDKLELDRW